MYRRKASSRLLVLAVILMAALGAAADGAAAAPMRAWVKNGSILPIGTANGMTDNCIGGPTTIQFSVGVVPIAISISKDICLEGRYYNSGDASEPTGTSEYSLRFTGAAVTSPGNKCTIPGGEMATNPLHAELIEPVSDTTHLYELIRPAAGSEYFTLQISGATCPVAGEYPVEGSIAGKGNVWGTESASQPFSFSPSVDSVTGHHLLIGEEPATLTGTVTGSSEGAVFGAK